MRGGPTKSKSPFPDIPKTTKYPSFGIYAKPNVIKYPPDKIPSISSRPHSPLTIKLEDDVWTSEKTLDPTATPWKPIENYTETTTGQEETTTGQEESKEESVNKGYSELTTRLKQEAEENIIAKRKALEEKRIQEEIKAKKDKKDFEEFVILNKEKKILKKKQDQEKFDEQFALDMLKKQELQNVLEESDKNAQDDADAAEAANLAIAEENKRLEKQKIEETRQKQQKDDNIKKIANKKQKRLRYKQNKLEKKKYKDLEVKNEESEKEAIASAIEEVAKSKEKKRKEIQEKVDAARKEIADKEEIQKIRKETILHFLKIIIIDFIHAAPGLTASEVDGFINKVIYRYLDPKGSKYRPEFIEEIYKLDDAREAFKIYFLPILGPVIENYSYIKESVLLMPNKWYKYYQTVQEYLVWYKATLTDIIEKDKVTANFMGLGDFWNNNIYEQLMYVHQRIKADIELFDNKNNKEKFTESQIKLLQPFQKIMLPTGITFEAFEMVLILANKNYYQLENIERQWNNLHNSRKAQYESHKNIFENNFDVLRNDVNLAVIHNSYIPELVSF
tara:strand:- start:7931 stop:9616 length:1686 start_codon:yes stop_codon:yes gene_type:complete